MTGNLTIEGSTELSDFLLSYIMYPTFQKRFFTKVPTNPLWAYCSNKHCAAVHMYAASPFISDDMGDLAFQIGA